MKYCTRCGVSASNKRFCSQCGFELIKSAPQAAYLESNSYKKTLIEDQRDLPVDLLIGRTINHRYFLESKLGVGGMGAVYRAKRLHIGDMAAVKILNPQHSTDSKAIERFQREARISAGLKHPNTVMVYDFGVSEDKLAYLVMELVEGRDLRSRIIQTGQISETDAAHILVQVCAVLDEAHRQNVVHRDLKPENILVYQTPAGDQVKVLDFGIAALRDLNVDKLTKAGSIVGTPHYMSPEQCMGEAVDGRSDIYSLGIILYEMLAGTVPFDSTTPTAIALQQVNDTPKSLRKLNPNVSPQVEAVVMHALKKKPEDRPQTASDFAQELLAAVYNHRTVSIEPKVTIEQLVKVSGPQALQATGKSSAFLLPAISWILLLAAVVGFGLWRQFKNDKAGQESTVSIVTNNDQVKAAAPQVTTNQPENPAPVTLDEKLAPEIEAKPSPPVIKQSVAKKAVETRKRIAETRKADSKRAGLAKKEAFGFDRDRRMMFDDYDRYRYRRDRYNSYWPDSQDRCYMRRGFRSYYR